MLQGLQGGIQMFNQILTLELGNNRGLRSSRNIKKLLYTYIVPNFSVITVASVLGAQKFYDP